MHRGAPKAIRALQQAGVFIGSIVVALGLAETSACVVHHGAFPYINIFQSDARYGVKLKPNSSTRVRSRDGNITNIRTNSLGFRGPEWKLPLGESAPPKGVLLLGDSQIFGYGVEYEATVASELSARLPENQEVFNASIPSWGPLESVFAAEEFIPKYKPRFVVFFANAANDWFETLPNTQRTVAHDGWVAHPRSVVGKRDFPFREYLMGRSHLVLAIRTLTHYIANPAGPMSEFVVRLKRDLPNLKKTADGKRSRLSHHLQPIVDTCKHNGCSVVAAALPVDVQVHHSEWKKYRAAPQDMTVTEALLQDFVDDAKDEQLLNVNLISALRRAEPGAFLSDDYHLSAKGHFAIAQALAERLQKQVEAKEVTLK